MDREKIRKLAGGLRYCARHEFCGPECPYHVLCNGYDELFDKAADTIEKLAQGRGTLVGWMSAEKKLPEFSGDVLVGIVSRDKTEFIHIANVEYSARHRAFNVHDWMNEAEAAKVKFDNRECYWMPLPAVP